MRSAIFFAVVFCVFASEGQATTVIAVWTDSAIVLGSDGKISRGDHSDTWSGCKIGTTNNVFWGEQGILEDPDHNFSVHEIIASAMAGSGTLDERVTAFEAAIVPKLTLLLNQLKNGDPNWYSKSQESKDPVAVVFAALENGTPNLRVLFFKATSDFLTPVSVEVEKRGCPGPTCRELEYASLGVHEIIEAEVSKNRTIWQKLGLKSAVRYLIEQEIAAEPEKVGPPIAIVEITRDGSHWASAGGCDAH